MSSRCRDLGRAAAVAAFAMSLALAGCQREAREFEKPAPLSGTASVVALSDLHPGPDSVSPAPPESYGEHYEENAYAVSQGSQLFRWYNCNGCHANGGGGMGPPLMDEKWIYGSDPQNIFATITEGRPNGMPSFRGHIPDDQVWQLVAYVRSLAGLVRKDVSPGRSDALDPGQSPQMQERQPTQPASIPGTSEH